MTGEFLFLFFANNEVSCGLFIVFADSRQSSKFDINFHCLTLKFRRFIGKVLTVE